jgi:hypothetical protein
MAREILPPDYPQLLADRDGSIPRDLPCAFKLGRSTDLDDWNHQVPVDRAGYASRRVARAHASRDGARARGRGWRSSRRELVRLHPEASARSLLQRVRPRSPKQRPPDGP